MDCSDTLHDPAWVAQTTTEEDLDEPPELQLNHPQPQQFQRTLIRRPSEKPSSLLTQAIQAQDQDEFRESAHSILLDNNQRRRSLTSNISIASTADLTSDTGLTSPSRTNTPSPPIPEMAMLRLSQAGFRISPNALQQATSQIQLQHVHEATAEIAKESAPRKRSIQFACAKPQREPPTTLLPTAQSSKPSVAPEPRRTCIRFACPSRPIEAPATSLEAAMSLAPISISLSAVDSSSTPKRISALSSALAASPSTVRRASKPLPARPRYLRANSNDLVKDSSQFHEFASGISRVDDWIRRDNSSAIGTKLTINDTFSKEISFRRLADEAEQEAQEEEDYENDDASDEDQNQDEDEEDDDDDQEEEEEDDDDSENDEDQDDHDQALDFVDGYSTDEETGFADSDDDEEEEDDNMIFWTPSQANVNGNNSNTPLARRHSATDQLSDCSTISNRRSRITRRRKPRRIHSDQEVHSLPDSTDFVCGTLDEDRPLEEAYLSCLAARRNEKLRLIPQDIDPSFPTSDPENDDDDGVVNASGETTWMPAKMDDVVGEDRSRRRKRSDQASPRKYHSPPPKRRLSPAPRPRARSPRPLLFDRRSPHRLPPHAPRALTAPLQSPRHGEPALFKLAGRPDVTYAKSLPRPAALFRSRSNRSVKKHDDEIHVRGAIDIVKGLERKRQRRREKFYQKYCNKARRGQIPERKTQPGLGAERMRELGLLMAGKKDPGNYVLSV